MVVSIPRLLVLRKAISLPGDPSEAQRAAGNYPKPRMMFQGLPISIENPRGSVRTGCDRDGNAWATSMQHDYGYIRGTLGVDGDHFDCFVGPTADAPMAYVITTMAPPSFDQPDEQKVMLGFNSLEEAKEGYLAHYDNPKFMGDVRAMTVDAFKRAVRTTRENPRMLKSALVIVSGSKSARS